MRSCMFEPSTALVRDQNPCILTVSFHPLFLLLSHSFIHSFGYTNECDSPSTHIHTHIPHNPTIIPSAHMLTTFSQSFRFLPFSVRMYEYAVAADVWLLIIWYLTQLTHTTTAAAYNHNCLQSLRSIPSELVRLFSQIYIHIRLNECLMNASMYLLCWYQVE